MPLALTRTLTMPAYAPPTKYRRTAYGRVAAPLAKPRARYSRYNTRLARASGPAGTTRRYVARVTREMPLYAPFSTARPEMKYTDVAQATYAADTTGTVTYLNRIDSNIGGIDQGREGSRVMMCGTQIRGFVVAGTTGTAARATMVLVYDRQPQGANPAITDIFETISSNSFQVTSTRDRFHILGRWDYTLIGNSTTPAVGKEAYQIDLKESFRKLAAFADSTSTGQIANIRTGGLFLLTFGDTAAGTAAPNFTLQVRTFYGDN